MHVKVRTIVAAAAIGVTGITGIAFVGPALFSASASTATDAPSPSPSAGPDQPKPPDQRLQRIKDALSDLVKAGTLTQKQADAVAEKLNQIGVRGPHGPGGPHLHVGRGGLKVALETAAKALGITTDELRTALRNGDTLAEVAQRQKVEVAKLVDALVEAATQRIDDAVADGRLPQARADRLKAELRQQITALVTEGRRGHSHDRAGTPGSPRTPGFPGSPA
jgi:hypothetical protein